MDEVLVANSFTGGMYPVDKVVIRHVIAMKRSIDSGKADAGLRDFWRRSTRSHTIYDLMMSGY